MTTTTNSTMAAVTPKVATVDSTSPRGVNVLLMGPSGTGKTHAIGTLADLKDYEVFYLGLESGLESLLGYYADRGLPIPANLQWHTLQTQVDGFASLAANASKVNMMSFEALTKMSDPGKSKYNQFVLLLNALTNFKSDRNGEEYGAVDKWDSKRVIVLDGLTGLCNMAMSLTIGGKPVRNQGEWAVAQSQVENILRMLCDGCGCHFVLLGHVEREVDQILGGTKLIVQSLGKALAPKIPAMFSDVILTVRSGSKWTWDTASPMADVKTRNLSIAADLKPDFAQIFSKWLARVEASQKST